jgi:hypothetical protein
MPPPAPSTAVTERGRDELSRLRRRTFIPSEALIPSGDHLAGLQAGSLNGPRSRDESNNPPFHSPAVRGRTASRCSGRSGPSLSALHGPCRPAGRCVCSGRAGVSWVHGCTGAAVATRAGVQRLVAGRFAKAAGGGWRRLVGRGRLASRRVSGGCCAGGFLRAATTRDEQCR